MHIPRDSAPPTTVSRGSACLRYASEAVCKLLAELFASADYVLFGQECNDMPPEQPIAPASTQTKITTREKAMHQLTVVSSLLRRWVDVLRCETPELREEYFAFLCGGGHCKWSEAGINGYAGLAAWVV